MFFTPCITLTVKLEAVLTSSRITFSTLPFTLYFWLTPLRVTNPSKSWFLSKGSEKFTLNTRLAEFSSMRTFTTSKTPFLGRLKLKGSKFSFLTPEASHFTSKVCSLSVRGRLSNTIAKRLDIWLDWNLTATFLPPTVAERSSLASL